MKRITLGDWLALQPIRGKELENGYTIPDTLQLVDRPLAWHLTDYVVYGVNGGSIWFVKRRIEK